MRKNGGLSASERQEIIEFIELSRSIIISTANQFDGRVSRKLIDTLHRYAGRATDLIERIKEGTNER